MGSQLSQNPTIYFGFGSNLWLHQMQIRCPTSKYLGVARLDGYKWIINERGYANVVQVDEKSGSTWAETDAEAESKLATVQDAPNDTKATNTYSNVVFGLVYSLQAADEARLDKNEGVPIAYTKENLRTKFWGSADGKRVDVTKRPTAEVDMLVYIDRKRTEEDRPKEEYVYRMNRGIEDAVQKGVPQAYVREVMRKFIPAEGGEERSKGTEDAEEKAFRQAEGFKDESGVF